jgi:hypothetical protein
VHPLINPLWGDLSCWWCLRRLNGNGGCIVVGARLCSWHACTAAAACTSPAAIDIKGPPLMPSNTSTSHVHEAHGPPTAVIPHLPVPPPHSCPLIPLLPRPYQVGCCATARPLGRWTCWLRASGSPTALLCPVMRATWWWRTRCAWRSSRSGCRWVWWWGDRRSSAAWLGPGRHATPALIDGVLHRLPQTEAVGMCHMWRPCSPDTSPPPGPQHTDRPTSCAHC